MNYYISNLNIENLDKRQLKKFINNWNNKISKVDNVYILGKFCSTRLANKVLKKLHGFKYLIASSSDYKSKHYMWIRSIKEIQDDKFTVVLCYYPIGKMKKDDTTVYLYGYDTAAPAITSLVSKYKISQILSAYNDELLPRTLVEILADIHK